MRYVVNVLNLSDIDLLEVPLVLRRLDFISQPRLANGLAFLLRGFGNTQCLFIRSQVSQLKYEELQFFDQARSSSKVSVWVALPISVGINRIES